MKIDHHILGALLVGGLFIFPVYFILPFFGLPQSLGVLFSILFGLLCGALYPDTDCRESRIFKMKQDKKKIDYQESYEDWKIKKNMQEIKNFFLLVYSSILIIFGFILRFIIYFPTCFIIYITCGKYLRKGEFINQHRGVSHTLIGVTVSTGLFFILFYLINLCFKFAPTEYIIFSTIFFFIGCNLHILQDSISKSGIQYLSPFKKTTIYGNYSAFSKDSRIFFLNITLGIVTILNFLISYKIGIYTLNSSINSIFGVLLIFLLPTILLVVIFGVLFRSCNVVVVKNKKA